MLTTFVKMADIGDLQDGEMRDAAVVGGEILRGRRGEACFAITNICSHFFTCLTTGELFSDRCEALCPLHDSRFNLAIGARLPATKPVKTCAVRVEGNDILVGSKAAGRADRVRRTRRRCGSVWLLPGRRRLRASLNGKRTR